MRAVNTPIGTLTGSSDAKACGTRYASAYPCCGQSRFEPKLIKALSGCRRWRIWDNKMDDWLAFFGVYYETRRDCVIQLCLNLCGRRLPFEPDDPDCGLDWLMRQDVENILEEARNNGKKKA